MRGFSRTQGATLIASLLMVVVLLAVIMAVTAQITLSTRRSSADQQQIGQAQYAAESGVARVQARLRLMQELLALSKFPDGYGNAAAAADIAALCNLGGLPAYTEGEQVLCRWTWNQPSPGLRTAPDGANSRVNLFLNAVNDAAFARSGVPGTTATSRSVFWSRLFSGTQGVPYTGGVEGQYSLTFGLQPTRVVRFAANSYQVFFQVPDLRVSGSAQGATRRLAVGAARPEYFMLVSRPSFARYALFTNHHFNNKQAEDSGNRITFTSRTLFSGPVHSNQQFRFEGTPWFGGKVTSAGCPAGSVGSNGCSADLQPGAWFGGAPTFVGENAMSPSKEEPSWCPPGTSGATCAANPTVKPTFGDGVTWNSPYVQLPENANDQQAGAQAGGLLLSGDVTELQLRRDEILGQEVQRITYTQDGKTVQLAYGPDRALQILDENGVWKPAQRAADGTISANLAPGAVGAPFNGVIHVAGGVQNLNAGAGNTTTSGPEGAAVASFAGLTVSATGNVNVTSNLRYTSPPCSGSHVRNMNGSVTPATCDNTQAENMLGIFSSGGDVNLVSPASCAGGPGTCPSLSKDPVIHAVMMASRGAVQVEGYNQGPADHSLGSVNLIGGVIENYYGAFGVTDGRGFGRNFVYDPRMNEDRTPPLFPTEQQWTVGLRVMKDVGGKPTPTELSGQEGVALSGDTVNVGHDGGGP